MAEGASDRRADNALTKLRRLLLYRHMLYRELLRAGGVKALMLMAIVAVSSGCTAVKPWQRARLAKPMMQLDPEPDSTLLEQHVYQYREGSTGGYGGLGGGCGCN